MKFLYSVKSVKDIQDLNPFIVVGCGGGGEKFSNLDGIEAVGFIDDDVKKQGTAYCGQIISGSLDECLENAPEAKSLVIMLPIGAEGTALKYAVQAIDKGLNVVTSFRSLSIEENLSLKKFADSKNVVIKEISPRLDVVEKIAGVAPEKSCEVLPKISYKPKAPVIFVGGTSQECVIFIEGQSSLTEKGNPHPRGLSAAILIGASPDAVIVGHRPNHPYREPRGIEEEIKAIEAVEPTKVVGLSVNLKNADLDLCPEYFESTFGLPAEDVYNNGASKLLDAILEYLEG